MRIIAISQLKTFWQKYPDSEQSLLAWIDEVKKANWQTPADIKGQFRHASVLKSRRVVFNIKGNDYRLVVAVAYRYSALYIKFVGTHK
ncbi:mRNA interferase HigB [Pseudomonas sp. TE36184]